MAAVPIIIIAEKLFEAALWVTGLLAAGVVVEKAIDAAKESEDEFDQKETKACVTCGTPPLEHPPVKSGTPPFPADSQELPNRTETPNNGPVGANDTGGQESVDTGPTVYNNESTKEETDVQFPEPGKPGKDDGYEPPKKPPKNADKNGRVPNPNGPGKGWLDANGDVWVPTGGKGSHGGEHWDVQTPGRGGRRGKHRNVYPGGHVR